MNRRASSPGWAAIAPLVLISGLSGTAAAQQATPPDPTATPSAEAPAGEESLARTEARLKQRFERLELLVGRLAELSGSTQPRRAALLRQLVTQSRQRDVSGQFDRVVAALEQERYTSALDGQNVLEGELQKLLDMLLQEDRERQIESQRKRIGRYLQDVNRIIRLQRAVKARTDGGDELAELAEDQQHVGDRTNKLSDDIDRQENAQDANQSGQSPQGAPSDAKDQSPAGSQEQRGDEQQKPAANQPPGEQAKPGSEGDQSKPQVDKPSGEPSADSSSPGESGQSSQPPQPGSGSPSGQPPGESPQAQSPQSPQSPEAESSPMQRATEQLRQARQRMDQAKQRLDEAQRDGAVDQQQQALEQLEQAKAELERILRQLREEELERMLVLLEARLRKMLDAQVEVYEETKKLDAAAEKAPAHELEIAGGRLSRKEAGIAAEADRALVLLREDGTSIAFPEAIEQARDDMHSIAERLQQTKFEMITQGLEEDVIAALEESLASLQQALDDLRDQKAGQAQQSGAPGEQPLVDKLAELRMIRALQQRVNDRTQRYGDMIDGEQAFKAELLEALDELSRRQQKIFQATRDLSREED
ncbi:MAG: hypothetical protein IT424_15555 [Pirellulales bacterium]|nr:hypothetical protein [Pirellulales bacterium]